MNFLTDQLNAWGSRALPAAWSMLWQSSLLIGLLLLLDLSLSRKLRPQVRYVLWLLMLVKLVLPPSMAAPTGVAWWVRPPMRAAHPHFNTAATVFYGPSTALPVARPAFVAVPPKPALSMAGGALAGSAGVSLVLLAFLLWRWRQVARSTAAGVTADPPPWLTDLLDVAREVVGVRRRPALRLVREPVAPGLFGLVRPVLLLPESLGQRLSPVQLRSVLLHELIHIRRRDVWVSCAQALLQVAYWWHPLVWVANSRIRCVREEAVDEAVMLALGGDADDYAPTLVEVARMAMRRSVSSLGLIGILESRNVLRGRIQRLISFQPPRKAGATLAAILCSAAVGALALPMGQAPAHEPAAGDDVRSPSPAPAASSFAGAAAADQSSSQGPPANTAAGDKKTEAKELVQEGKLLFEMGKTDEAGKKFTQALQQNPLEQAAYYYLNLVKEARSKQVAGLRKVGPNRQHLLDQLQNIQLETVEFDSTPLDEVIKTLNRESRLRDSAGHGVNFIISQQESQDLQNVTIRLVPAVTMMRLADALDAIVKTADKPLKYSIEDYGIVFSLKRDDALPLYTRVFKVDPNTMKHGLSAALGKSEPITHENTIELLRGFLASINVDLSPPKSVFYNEREGSAVMVRATLQDLDTIETAIQVLNIEPAQLNIKARFLELTEAEEEAFWAKHTAPEQSPASSRFVQLTGKEAQKQFDDWKSKDGTDLLSQLSVTTLSGRQAEIQTVQVQDIVTYTNDLPVTQAVPLGPTLDVLPTVSADRLRFDLAMKASLNEFLGYDEPAGGGRPVPHFRLRQLPLTVTVWDGHTLVIGGAMDEQNRPADKLGDNKKRLLVAITPCVIDPAGNRLHTDEEVESAIAKMGVLRR